LSAYLLLTTSVAGITSIYSHTEYLNTSYCRAVNARIQNHVILLVPELILAVQFRQLDYERKTVTYYTDDDNIVMGR
jgi:hypothetical protein